MLLKDPHPAGLFSIMEYPLLTLRQAQQLSNLSTVMISGIIRFSGSLIYLEQADLSLRLVGQPFSGLLLPGQKLDMWGEYLPGKQPSLLVHDARRVGDTSRQPQVTPPLKLALDVMWPIVKVVYHAQEQIALTPDGLAVVLYGEELDQRHYALEARIINLQPLVAGVLGAVPVTPVFWSSQGRGTSA